MIIGKKAPLTAKEKLVQRVIDVNDPVKGKHAPFEASINKTLGHAHILNDDEYRFMFGKGRYNV
jgi:hypothetical protein